MNLTKLEQDKIKIFIKDEVLYNAVKKTLLSTIGSEFNFNTNLSDEVIGQKTRARKEAVGLLKSGFKALEQCRGVEQEPKENINQAR